MINFPSAENNLAHTIKISANISISIKVTKVTEWKKKYLKEPIF